MGLRDSVWVQVMHPDCKGCGASLTKCSESTRACCPEEQHGWRDTPVEVNRRHVQAIIADAIEGPGGIDIEGIIDQLFDILLENTKEA